MTDYPLHPLEIKMPSETFRLNVRSRKQVDGRGLVKIFTSWSLVEICETCSWLLAWTCSLTKWYKYAEPRLSHRSLGGACRGTCSSRNRFLRHMISVVAVATARYSAFIDDQATMRCFLDNQEIGLPPKKMMKADVEVRSSELPPTIGICVCK